MRYTTHTYMISLSTSESSLTGEARQLVILLSGALKVSNLSDIEKSAWAALLPEMRLDQLAKFADILDISIAKKAKTELSETQKSIQTIQETQAAKQAEIDNGFMQSITKMNEQLRRA